MATKYGLQTNRIKTLVGHYTQNTGSIWVNTLGNGKYGVKVFNFGCSEYEGLKLYLEYHGFASEINVTPSNDDGTSPEECRLWVWQKD
jgi:hypothetical protein